uniref:Uncharacterized protein n=1 Tax=Anopheles farauti TaxID=69004 RepID=A0A182Q899_9DIPT
MCCDFGSQTLATVRGFCSYAPRKRRTCKDCRTSRERFFRNDRTDATLLALLLLQLLLFAPFLLLLVVLQIALAQHLVDERPELGTEIGRRLQIRTHGRHRLYIDDCCGLLGLPVTAHQLVVRAPELGCKLIHQQQLIALIDAGFLRNEISENGSDSALHSDEFSSSRRMARGISDADSGRNIWKMFSANCRRTSGSSLVIG